MCFCYIWKDKSLLILNLFTSEYLDQIPLWKEIKEIFSVKLQTENLFLFKIIIKTHASQIRDIMLGNKFGLFQVQLEGVWGRDSSKNILKFLPTCKFGNGISSTDTKLFYNVHFSFLENWQFNHILGPPLSFKILCLK